MSKPILLVVDDESLNINIIVDLLEELYTIKVAFNGKQALKIAQKLLPDLILLDISMPEMDGYEVATHLMSHDQTKEIPFLFLTSKDDKESIIKGFKLGAIDYITKPFNIDELHIRVSNHIKTHLLKKEILEQKKFTQTILDDQPNMIILTNGREIDYANHSFLEFYGYEKLEDFKNHYGCVCETFMHDDNYFHPGKIPPGESWIKHVKELSPEERIVLILDKEYVVKSFNISIKKYSDSRYIINLNDISATILKQMEYKEKATHDKLTGIYNREYFNHTILNTIVNTKNDSKLLGLILFDIDHFKNINDIYGHNVGDEVLIALSKLIEKNLRRDDIFVRWGGEEFIVVISVSDIDNITSIAENLREKISSTPFDTVSSISASFGTTVYIDPEPIEESIGRADEALYKSKNSGRNQVTFL